MDYIRFNAALFQVDTSLIISIPDVGVGSGPIEQNVNYVAPAPGWVWVSTNSPQVQAAIMAAIQEGE